MKRLKKSQNKSICGVCGGIAEFFDIDPTWVRVGYITLTLLSAFPGILLYLIAALVMPKT